MLFCGNQGAATTTEETLPTQVRPRGSARWGCYRRSDCSGSSGSSPVRRAEAAAGGIDAGACLQRRQRQRLAIGCWLRQLIPCCHRHPLQRILSTPHLRRDQGRRRIMGRAVLRKVLSTALAGMAAPEDGSPSQPNPPRRRKRDSFLPRGEEEWSEFERQEAALAALIEDLVQARCSR
jgi:hypothetical protein